MHKILLKVKYTENIDAKCQIKPEQRKSVKVSLLNKIIYRNKLNLIRM